MPTQTLTFYSTELGDIIRQHLYKQGLEPTADLTIRLIEPDRPWDTQDISVTVTVRPIKESSPPANLTDPRNAY